MMIGHLEKVNEKTHVIKGLHETKIRGIIWSEGQERSGDENS